jgi:hypothetical protein
MTEIIQYLGDNWASLALPLAIGIALAWFVRNRRLQIRSFEERIRRREEFSHLDERRLMAERLMENSESSPIMDLLEQEGVSLRLLEEVYEGERFWPVAIGLSSVDSDRRAWALRGIQRQLREFLRTSIKNDNFPGIRDRTIGLLDEVSAEIEKIQREEPFSDILDPERSLLIDISHEIDPAKTLVHQKTLQLANIIKIKHQDIMKLQAENSKAASWTRWGTAGTVFFGLLSLALSIWTVVR